MPTRDQWQALLDQHLPPKDAYVARNRAITACYARWYLQEPWLFKWAGMASFASDQVGVALAMGEMLQSPHGAVRPALAAEYEPNLLDLGVALYGKALSVALQVPLALHDSATQSLLLNDLELIKQGNDAIFDDIGWCHLAYTKGGLPAIEAELLAGGQRDLLDGFRMIDEGARRLGNLADYEAGARLISEGAVAMLRHEQMNVLPTFFERMSDLGRVFASVGAWLDFDGGVSLSGQPWFSGHYGTLAIVSGRRSVTNPDDRWEWIERDVLPKWARADRSYSEDCAMHRRLEALANEAPTMLQQAAAVMNMVYPALGLKANPLTSRPLAAAQIAVPTAAALS